MLTSHQKIASAVIQVGLLAALAVALRVTGLDQTPDHDEIYHILAARSWAAEGTLRIADGEYTRVALYTIGLGYLFDWFGESLFVARLPSLIAGVLLVVALYVWTRRVAGGLAAWIAALLLCFSPIAIDMSQFTRFYALQALLFWLGASWVYGLSARPISKGQAAAFAAAAALALAGAFYLQRLTLVGLAGLAFWGAVKLAPTWWRAWSSPRLRIPMALMHVLALIVLAGVLWSGVADSYLWDYQRTLPWFTGRDPRHYYWLLVDQHPTLWTLLPVAAVVALARRTEPALHCLCVFAVAFVVLSLAGTQAERYIYFVLPQMFALTGIAVAEFVPMVRDVTSTAIERTMGLERNTGAGKALTQACLAGMAIYILAFNAAIPTTLRMLGMQSTDAGPDWTAARELLAPQLKRVSTFVISTSSVRALYFFGRYDLEYSQPHVRETDTGQDFGIDQRTGRPVIASAEALKRVIECHPAGLVIDHFPAGSFFGFGREALAVLADSATQLDLPDRYQLRAYAWEHPDPPPQIDCIDLP